MELRISESTLRARIAELESALEGHELRARLAALEEKERQARSRADAAASEADLARRECSAAAQRVKDLGAQLAQARSECELYISEIETTSTAYDEMQVQNTRLLGQLTEKDEANNVLLAERIKGMASCLSCGRPVVGADALLKHCCWKCPCKDKVEPMHAVVECLALFWRDASLC
eukprot:1160436-Pelagomonas_calceolata.AAC.5